ncbi:MAG: hypothetical protein WDZ49_12560 [Litorilinea sp.]
MNRVYTSHLHRTVTKQVTKIAAAVLLAAFVATTPMVMDSLLDTEMTTLAVAGRPQSGIGEY